MSATPRNGASRPVPVLAGVRLAAAASSTAAPAGDPQATISAPTDGATLSAGTTVALKAALNPDLVTALQAGTGGCYLTIGDDAHSTATGTLDLSAGTCTGNWTFTYAAAYSLTAHVTTPAGITYASPPITVTVTGGSDPRCTGQTGAPSTCVYHWTEVYYISPNDTRYARVCAIDGGCQWQTAHTSWRQLTGDDYWIDSTGQTLPDGDNADAYVCLGSSPTGWTSYANTHDFTALLTSADTSAAPVPAGTC